VQGFPYACDGRRSWAANWRKCESAAPVAQVAWGIFLGKPELGLKCTCVGCGARFFDLLRVPAVCPKCGIEQPKAAPRVLGAGRAAPRRWQGRLPTFQAEAPEAVVAGDTEEGLEDEDAVDPGDVEDDEPVAAETDDADERVAHPD
jgi:uncharacterized protein (TIGR02300 family)